MDALHLYCEIFRLFVLTIVLVGAVYGDLAKGRIPNSLTIGGSVLGLLIATSMGMGSLGKSFLGIIFGAGPLLVIYLIGLASKKPLMGAGDVKLIAAIGSLAGPGFALWSIYYGLWIAAFVAVGIIILYTIQRKPRPQMLPFGSFLSIGAAITLFYRGFKGYF